MGEEADEIDEDDLNEGFSTNSTSHDFCDDQVKKFKQVSSMGLSCMVNTAKNPIIDLEVNFGFYIKSTILEENEGGKVKEISKWNRKQFNGIEHLKLDGNLNNFNGDLECKIFDKLVAEHPDCFYSTEILPRLHLKTRSIDKDRMSVSIFLSMAPSLVTLIKLPCFKQNYLLVQILKFFLN